MKCGPRYDEKNRYNENFKVLFVIGERLLRTVN